MISAIYFGSTFSKGGKRWKKVEKLDIIFIKTT
jgi:hypothetical protein